MSGSIEIERNAGRFPRRPGRRPEAGVPLDSDPLPPTFADLVQTARRRRRMRERRPAPVPYDGATDTGGGVR